MFNSHQNDGLSLKNKTSNSGLFLIVDKSWQTNESTIARGDCNTKKNNIGS